jgi:hypothetical protein
VDILPNGAKKYGGYEYMVFSAIQSKLRFTHTIGQPKVCCLWGLPSDGGNWTGLIGDLYNGFTDVAWAGLFVMPERKELFDYTEVIKFDETTFMVNKPGPLPQWTAPIEPFTGRVIIIPILVKHCQENINYVQ